jgi:hypothetical protein
MGMGRVAQINTTPITIDTSPAQGSGIHHTRRCTVCSKTVGFTRTHGLIIEKWSKQVAIYFSSPEIECVLFLFFHLTAASKSSMRNMS